MRDFDQFNVLAEPHHPVDWQILQLVTSSFEHRPWALREIFDQIAADHLAVRDGLMRLMDVRLIQNIESYFIPTRAAMYYSRLAALSQSPPRSQRRL